MPKNNTGQNIAKSTEATPVDDFTVISRQSIGTYLFMWLNLFCQLQKFMKRKGDKKWPWKTMIIALLTK